MQTLYGIEIGKHEPEQALDDLFERVDAGEQRGFIRDFVLGTIEQSATGDAVIAPLLLDWTLDRLPTLDRLILRMSVYEMRNHPETPTAVVINEAVELAKRFSTEDSGRFVNGVLANASKAGAP